MLPTLTLVTPVPCWLVAPSQIRISSVPNRGEGRTSQRISLKLGGVERRRCDSVPAPSLIRRQLRRRAA